MIATFVSVFNGDKTGVGFGCFYIVAGLLSFGSLSIGKERINPEKPIRNILFFLMWSLLGFSMMAIGIASLRNKSGDNSLLTMFLVLIGFALIIVYIISIIKNKDWFAILSVGLFALGIFLGVKSNNGMLILQILTLLTLLAAAVSFVISFFKSSWDDDDY